MATKRSTLTVVFTTIMIFIFVLVLTVSFALQKGVAFSKERLGADIVVFPDAVKADASQILYTAVPENVYMPRNLVEKISQFEGIENVSPQFFVLAQEADCCSYGEEIILAGYDETTDFILKPFMNAQNFGNLDDKQAIIGSDVVALLENQVSIEGNLFTVIDRLIPTGSLIDNTIYVNIDTARNIAKENENLNDLWSEDQPEDLISSIFIKTKYGADTAEVAKKINAPGLAVQAIETSNTINNVRIQMEIIIKFIIGLRISAIVITILSLFVIFSSFANERKKDVMMGAPEMQNTVIK